MEMNWCVSGVTEASSPRKGNGKSVHNSTHKLLIYKYPKAELSWDTGTNLITRGQRKHFQLINPIFRRWVVNLHSMDFTTTLDERASGR